MDPEPPSTDPPPKKRLHWFGIWCLVYLVASPAMLVFAVSQIKPPAPELSYDLGDVLFFLFGGAFLVVAGTLHAAIKPDRTAHRLAFAIGCMVLQIVFYGFLIFSAPVHINIPWPGCSMRFT